MQLERLKIRESAGDEFSRWSDGGVPGGVPESDSAASQHLNEKHIFLYK